MKISEETSEERQRHRRRGMGQRQRINGLGRRLGEGGGEDQSQREENIKQYGAARQAAGAGKRKNGGVNQAIKHDCALRKAKTKRQ